MEGNYLTSGDLALLENHRGYGYGCGYGYDHYKKRDNVGVTGLGLAAGLGGAALLGVFAIGWGLNQASKARAKGAEQATNLLNNNLAQMSTLVLAERQSREAWQNYHSPSTTQYVDVRTGAGSFAGAGATSNAWAQAEANILSQTLTGGLSRCPQEVTLVSKRNCPCPASDCGCN